MGRNDDKWWKPGPKHRGTPKWLKDGCLLIVLAVVTVPIVISSLVLM